MKNVHIYPSPMTRESRIMREVGAIDKMRAFSAIELIGVATDGLADVQQLNDRVVIRRLGPHKGKGGICKLFRHLSWCGNVLRHCLRVRPACINCHSLPVLPIGVVVKLLCGASLLYDAHELETEVGGLRGIRKRFSKWVERWCIGFADLVIVVSDGIKDWYEAAYGPTAMVTVLNTPPIRARTRSRALRDALGIPSDRTIVLYQGALGVNRGIESLLDAFAAHPSFDMDLVFLGYGELESRIKEAAQRDRRIHFHPAVAPDDVLEYTASADIGVHLMPDSCLNHRWALPNKLFEYIMAGLVVVVSDLPEMARVVRNYGIGIVASGSEPDAVVTALRHAAALDRAVLAENLAKCSDDHCWERQERAMIEAYRRYVPC